MINEHHPLQREHPMELLAIPGDFFYLLDAFCERCYH